MANQHMMTAASNLERALSDINLYKNELRVNLDNLKRTNNERLKEIERNIQMLRADQQKTDSNQRKAGDSNNIRMLEDEKKQLVQQQNDEEKYVNNQLTLADQNSLDITQFMKRLQMMV